MILEADIKYKLLKQFSVIVGGAPVYLIPQCLHQLPVGDTVVGRESLYFSPEKSRCGTVMGNIPISMV